ncbi:ribonuclease-III-like-domain-containing protein [Halenospora varia]|nr:ribonuclease-III-like-domain-containing protein [Halenospora varia]
MASRTITRPLRTAIRRTQPVCECANSTSSRTASIRQFASSASRREVQWDTDRAERPRWAATPESMKAPYPWKPRDPANEFHCNEDPDKLDRFYVKLLGRGGDALLTDEVKWLAITHKSFDQGRRGFNDRLAFFGRRILSLQTNMALVHSPIATQTQSRPARSDDREPFTHPALEGLANLSEVPMGQILTKERLANLATEWGMREIMRWKPRNTSNLNASGVEVVLNSCTYAIIGAIALQRGGAVAAEVAREKVLKPLGIS